MYTHGIYIHICIYNFITHMYESIICILTYVANWFQMVYLYASIFIHMNAYTYKYVYVCV